MKKATTEQQSPRLQKLKQQQADLLQKIRLEQQKLIRGERKRETRLTFLVGIEALAEAKENEEWSKRLVERLDKSLQRNGDRELFGLELIEREGTSGE